MMAGKTVRMSRNAEKKKPGTVFFHIRIKEEYP